MQYMCLIYSDENSGPQPGTPEFGEYISAYGRFTETIQNDGVFIAGDALQPTMAATTVTMETGSPQTMDGPFAETKEQLAGFYLLDANDLNEALQLASRIPPARFGSIEVRPARELPPKD